VSAAASRPAWWSNTTPPPKAADSGRNRRGQPPSGTGLRAGVAALSRRTGDVRCDWLTGCSRGQKHRRRTPAIGTAYADQIGKTRNTQIGRIRLSSAGPGRLPGVSYEQNGPSACSRRGVPSELTEAAGLVQMAQFGIMAKGRPKTLLMASERKGQPAASAFAWALVLGRYCDHGVAVTGSVEVGVDFPQSRGRPDLTRRMRRIGCAWVRIRFA
jgi:hypothetical protein